MATSSEEDLRWNAQLDERENQDGFGEEDEDLTRRRAVGPRLSTEARQVRVHRVCMYTHTLVLLFAFALVFGAPACPLALHTPSQPPLPFVLAVLLARWHMRRKQRVGVNSSPLVNLYVHRSVCALRKQRIEQVP